MPNSFIDGGRYEGRVLEAAFIEAKSGTRGFQLHLEDETTGAGDDYFVIWLTASAAEQAKRSFASLGVTLAQLQDPTWYGPNGDNLIRFVVGKRVPFWTKLEEYKGQTRIKIGGVGEGGMKVVKPNAEDIAGFFSSCFPSEETDDIPF